MASAKDLEAMDIRQLQDECRNRDIPWQGVKSAEELRKLLAPKAK